VPLAQHTEALCDSSGRGDIELAAKPHTRPPAIAKHNNFEG
jgi:hypothetical protein